ncbi:MAG: hypothetical protein ABTQ28_20610, partial [Thauera sp.]
GDGCGNAASFEAQIAPTAHLIGAAVSSAPPFATSVAPTDGCGNAAETAAETPRALRRRSRRRRI